MAGQADFHADARRKLGRNAQPRAKNFQDERIACPNEFNAAADADAECLEPVRILIVHFDAAHDGTDMRRQFIKPHGGGGLVNGCHNACKISFPAAKSNARPEGIDAGRTA